MVVITGLTLFHRVTVYSVNVYVYLVGCATTARYHTPYTVGYLPSLQHCVSVLPKHTLEFGNSLC